MKARHLTRAQQQLTSAFLGIGAIATILCIPLPAQAQSSPEIKTPQYWVELCTTLANNNKPEEALVACGKALKRRKRSAALWTIYSTLQLGQKQYPEALVSINQALKRKPKNNAFALTQRCIIHAALKQANEALTDCDQALKINENWGSYSPEVAWRYRGLVLDQAEQYQGALVAYQKTLESKPSDSLTLVYACEALVKLQRPEEALAQCQAALDGDGSWGPASPALALQNQGSALMQLEEYGQAVALYDQVIALLPEAHQAWTQQGFALSQLQQYIEALSSYQQATELKADHSRALVGQCLAMNKLGQYETALEACKAAIAGNGEWWEDGPVQAWSQQSRALAGLGKWEEALALANRAVGMEPSYFPAVSDRAIIHWNLGDAEAALSDTQQASQLNPRDPIPWRNEARFLRALGEYKRALIAYNQANQLDPNDADTWANRSTVLWHLGWQEDALASANKAIELDENLVLGWQNRSVALAALKRYKEAQESYLQALRRNPDDPELWAGISLVLIQLEAYEDAVAAIEQALALDPQQPLALKAFDVLEEWLMQQQPNS